MKFPTSRIKNLLNVKHLGYLLGSLNLICIIVGILYYTIPIDNNQWGISWDSFGIIILITLFANISLLFIDSWRLNKMSIKENRINLFCYFMLTFIINSCMFIFLGNFLISTSYNTSHLGFLLVGIGYFGDFLFGLFLSYLNISQYANEHVWNSKIHTLKQSKKMRLFKKILKFLLGSITILTLIGGIYFAYCFLLAPLDAFIPWLINMFTLQFAIFLSIAFLVSTVILLKLINIKKRPKIYYSIGIIGLFLTNVFLFPLFSIPYTTNQAEQDFNDSFLFGMEVNNFIDPYSQQFFMKDPFSLPGYFLGIPPEEGCRIIQHIPFYVGEGIVLFYDAYIPMFGGTFLPGNNSVIIKIHGGGWTAGDKGSGNMLQVNKYLASQGYIVFDIQYGLIKDEDSIFQRFAPTPEYVKGFFTIENQVKHIGEFIKKLNSTQFSFLNLNLHSVFLMGGSAGGHLALTTALLVESGEYNDWFGTHIDIKGIIPLYPGDPSLLYAGGNLRLKTPEYFYINESTPPCLIFQGTKDFCSLKAENIQQSYELSLNHGCCIISFPFQGHANDLYYSNHFNQILIFYLERFLYLCNYGYIL